VNKDEALKLALEVLEDLQGGCTDSDDGTIEAITVCCPEAIIAIKEALAQSDQESDDLTIAYMAGLYDGKNKCTPQPEQEPVAWNVVDPTGKIVATEMNSVRGWARIEGYKPTVEGLLGFHEQGWRVVPTTPPQRKPLPPQSPCEMTQAEGKMFKLGWLECEAAHGIKGE